MTVPPTTPYAELGTDEQVSVVTEAAEQALVLFDLVGARVDLVLHEYNSTFRATDDHGRAWALRVNTNSASTPSHIRAQQAWLAGVASLTGTRVPVPRATTDGQWFATVNSPGWGGQLRATCASWLPGEQVDTLGPDRGRELGRTMAVLHQFSRGTGVDHSTTPGPWRPPPDAELPPLVEPLFGDRDRLSSRDPALDEALARSRAAFAVADEPPIAIHADLHGGNLLWDPSLGIGVLDVDDMGVGTPALDLAIATYYLRDPDDPSAEATEAALRDGYREVTPLPRLVEDDPAAFEGLVAARALLLANYLQQTTTAAHRAEAEQYLELTITRARRWLDTGWFSR